VIKEITELVPVTGRLKPGEYADSPPRNKVKAHIHPVPAIPQPVAKDADVVIVTNVAAAVRLSPVRPCAAGQDRLGQRVSRDNHGNSFIMRKLLPRNRSN
jgi:hypothetical protein